MHQLEAVPCPLCGAAGDFPRVRNTRVDVHIRKYGDIYAGLDRSEWRVCSACGFLHQNPRPSVATLNQFYSQSRYHTELPAVCRDPEGFLRAARLWYTDRVAFALRHSGLRAGKVFDVGAGLGGALKLFEGYGWQAAGVEPDESNWKFARESLGLTGLGRGVLTAGVEPSGDVDLVFSNHTFEHVADLHDVMRGVVRLLKPGGYMFTVVPTHYRNRSNLSRRWMNAAHYSMFTHRSLNHLLSYHGLEEVAHTYRGPGPDIDELWHLARFTGVRTDPRSHYEDPQAVRRYVDRVNPVNTVLYAPMVWARQAVRSYPAQVAWLLVRSPREFFARLTQRLGGRPAPGAARPAAEAEDSAPARPG